MFSQRHYEAIAKVIREQTAYAVSDDDWTTLKMVTQALQLMFKLDNPRFKAERFFKACGL